MPRAIAKPHASREAFVYSLDRPLESNQRSVDMKVALAAALFLVPLIMSCNKSPSPLPPSLVNTDGWQPLFNGRDLEGWQHVGPGQFVIEDGVLRSEGGMGLLWYTGEKLG